MDDSVKSKPVWQLIFEIAERMQESAIRRTSKEERDNLLGLTISQQRALRSVREYSEREPEGISLKLLADSIGLTSGTTSSLVESLVQMKILERTTAPQDRRAVRIRLSEYGENKIRKGRAYFNGMTERFLDTVSEADREGMASILMRFHQYVGTIDEEKE